MNVAAVTTNRLRRHGTVRGVGSDNGRQKRMRTSSESLTWIVLTKRMR